MKFWDTYKADTVKGVKEFHFEEIDGVKHIVLEEDGFSFKYSFATPPEENTKLKEIIIDSAKAAVSLYYETGLCDWDNS